ncbi:MAG: hypothetical protein EKK34_29640 [Mycobacterium sp.]|nr:MAG: hypothetical protein EKK34_29640 [Mycobacterium sp.]
MTDPVLQGRLQPDLAVLAWQVTQGVPHVIPAAGTKDEPWFGQTPSSGARQYMILAPEGVKPTVDELVRLGILDNYGPPLGR